MITTVEGLSHSDVSILRHRDHFGSAGYQFLSIKGYTEAFKCERKAGVGLGNHGCVDCLWNICQWHCV
jgi:hypothetical protein